MSAPVSYTQVLNELNREIHTNQPEDILQFCANFFQRKLEADRTSRNSQAKNDAQLIKDNNDERSGRVRSPSPGTTPTKSNFSFDGDQAPMSPSTKQDKSAIQITSGPFGRQGNNSAAESFPANYNANRRTSVSAESMLPSTDNSYQRVFIPKTPTQLQRIDKAISQNLLFKNLDEEQLKDVMDAMSEKRITTPGSVIIKQGDVGDFFYVVESGSFDIYVRSDDVDDSQGRNFGRKVAFAREGGSFGELALMYNAPRAATVVSNTLDCVVWALDRITFRRILMENTSRKRKMYESFLETVHVLSALGLAERQKIADALDTCVFEKGAVVIRQGDSGEQFFMIESGEAEVIKDDEGVVARLGKGDYFGESALINDAPRNATVQAASRLKVATLGKRAFTRLLGPVIDIMKREHVN